MPTTQQTETRAEMPRIAEYSQLRPADYAVDTVITVERRKNDYGRVIAWTLAHRGIGYVPAGSACRYQATEVYRVFTFDASSNTTIGQGFKTLEEARNWLDARGEVA